MSLDALGVVLVEACAGVSTTITTTTRSGHGGYGVLVKVGRLEAYLARGFHHFGCILMLMYEQSWSEETNGIRGGRGGPGVRGAWHRAESNSNIGRQIE